MNKLELENLMYPLQSEKIFLSAQLSSVIENYLQDNSQDLHNQIQNIKSQIANIDDTLNPLKQQYNQLHSQYYVVFTTEMLYGIGDKKSKFTYPIYMISETKCDIDTETTGFDFKIPLLKNLVADLGSKLMHSYGEVRFERITLIR
ncbi:hypothetical protein [Flavobacterium johnsoniae]|uniref:hypothetical protein n=1 Tax=Flavobacterium johnsoniae TaxID=986 RepID=UPI003D984325